MNMMPASVQFFAKEEFSLRKPYPGWILSQPLSRATWIILSPSRYALGDPRFIANGLDKACCELASGSVYMVVVLIPYFDAVRLTRLSMV